VGANRRRCLIVVVFLYLWIALSTASVALHLGRLALIDRLGRSCALGLGRSCTISEGRAVVHAADASDHLQVVVSIVTIAMLVATGIAWLAWQGRAHRILREKLSVQDAHFTPGWGVGCWFVPFGNLVLPYRAVSELWRASDAERPGLIWRAESAPWRIRLWWAGWLITSIFARIDLLASHDQTTAGTFERSLRTHTLEGIGVDICVIATTLLAISVVTGIQGRQERALAMMLGRVAHPPPVAETASGGIPLPPPPSALSEVLSTVPPGPSSVPSSVPPSVPASATSSEAPGRSDDQVRPVTVGVGVAIAAIAGVVVAVIVTSTLPKIPASALDPSAAPVTPTFGVQPLASGWRLFDDPNDGFAIGIPQAWSTEQPKEPETKFLASGPSTEQGSGTAIVYVTVAVIGDVALD